MTPPEDRAPSATFLARDRVNARVRPHGVCQ